MSTSRQGMTSAEIDQIVAQRVIRQGTTVEKNSNNKMKFENQPKDNRVPRQPPCKKPSVTRAYTIGANERRVYAENLPYYNKCKLHHVGPCTVKCSKLGSFDVIIGIDWLVNHQAMIICDEEIVRIPYGDEVLRFQGDEGGKGEKSKLSIISCTKTQKYIKRGCLIFLAQVTKKETVDKSQEKRLEDVPTVRDFPKGFLEDLLGLPPMRQVEFQINLVPSAALVARAPYRLVSSELQELSTELQELSDKGFI
uniref:Putative reverse transcriptase domain-containing protein n=1 Tax=Tanacetum cinerariifolium TaxID=118510 RepID=A0A699H0P4_TANCI|nr:putative reverse transcriptase domain-containing protein [Tanacetum cinerariifolium]